MINNGQEFLVVDHDKVKPLSHFPVSLKRKEKEERHITWRGPLRYPHRHLFSSAESRASANWATQLAYLARREDRSWCHATSIITSKA